MNTLLWAVFPYVALTLFFVVPFIRMIYRPYGITTRASGMFNRDLLGLAALALHWGILLIFIGHILGFVGGHLGSALAVDIFYWMGLLGGVLAIFGSIVALLRRVFVPEVRALSQSDDYLIHLFLIAIIGFALYQGVVDRIWGVAFTASAWFASIWRFQPEPELMASAGWITQTHVLLALAFAAYFPFTKLVHAWTYPINFAVRPYQSMRTAAQKFRRRWELGGRTDQSFLTYAMAATVALFVAAGLFLAEPVFNGGQTATEDAQAAAAAPAEATPVAFAPRGAEQMGYPLYVSQCARCHGIDADGNGPGKDSPTFATLPRDLTAGKYRFVSTLSGIASDEDLRHVLVNGLPSAGMPAFADLSDAQLDSLVAFMNDVWVDRPDAGPRVEITPQPEFTEAMREAGRQLYADNCAACHGDDGAGNGPAAAMIEDFPGHPLPPANLAAGEIKAGSDPVQLYYRIAAGIPNGDAPLMPAYNYLTPEEIWSLVAYLRRGVLPGKPLVPVTAR